MPDMHQVTPGQTHRIAQRKFTGGRLLMGQRLGRCAQHAGLQVLLEEVAQLIPCLLGRPTFGNLCHAAHKGVGLTFVNGNLIFNTRLSQALL